jgi:hypothetical protein
LNDIDKKGAQERSSRFIDLFNTVSALEIKETIIHQQFNQRKKDLDDAYAKGLVDNYQKAYDEIRKIRDNDLESLESEKIRQSDLFKSLGKDIIGFSTIRIKEEVKRLQKQLTEAAGLTPELRSAIESRINALLDLLHKSDKTSIKLLNTGSEFNAVGSSLQNLGSELSGINEELGNTISILGKLASSIGSVFDSLDKFNAAKEKGDVGGQISAIGGIVGTAVGIISTVVGIFNKAAERRRALQKETEEFNTKIFVGEQEINALYRERAREQVLINQLRLDGLRQEKALLEQQREQIKGDIKTVLDELAKQKATAPPGISPFFQNLIPGLQESLSLANKSFDDLEKLFLQGRLEGKAKELFEELQKLKQEGIDVDKLLAQNAQTFKEALTGTTAESITDSIEDGFKQAKRTIADFADTFEELTRNAIFNALKVKFLEPAFKSFFEEFAAAAESDNTLTSSELTALRNDFNKKIKDANDFLKQLQQVSGVDIFGGVSAAQNTLTGAFRTMSEDTGNVLAGQFAGQRIVTIELKEIQKNALGHLNNIEQNTAITWQEIKAMHSKMEYYFRDQGVKMR